MPCSVPPGPADPPILASARLCASEAARAIEDRARARDHARHNDGDPPSSAAGSVGEPVESSNELLGCQEAVALGQELANLEPVRPRVDGEEGRVSPAWGSEVRIAVCAQRLELGPGEPEVHCDDRA